MLYSFNPSSLLIWFTIVINLRFSLSTHFLNSDSRRAHEQHVERSVSGSEYHPGSIQVNLHRRHSEIIHQKRDHAIQSGFNYGHDKIRGVNIGGWLVGFIFKSLDARLEWMWWRLINLFYIYFIDYFDFRSLSHGSNLRYITQEIPRSLMNIHFVNC